MKFNLPTESSSTFTIISKVTSGHRYVRTFAAAQFPEDTPQYAKDVWCDWRPMARIVDGRVVIPFEHERFYNTHDLKACPHVKVPSDFWMSLGDDGLRSFLSSVTPYREYATDQPANHGWSMIKLGSDTFKDVLKRPPVGCLRHDSITPETCVLHTARVVPLEVLTQLPDDAVIVTTVDNVGDNPVTVNGRQVGITYTTTRSGRVLGFKVGPHLTGNAILQTSESARLTYGMVALPECPKILILKWRFGQLHDVIQVSSFPVSMKTVYVDGDGMWTHDRDFFESETDVDYLRAFEVPADYSDEQIKLAVGRASFEN